MSYILDTNVISELARKRPDPQVIDWIDALDEAQAYLSVITVGELNKGIEKLTNKKRKAKLGRWLHVDLVPRFGSRILNLDMPIMLAWGALNADLESRGQSMPAIDSLIAATAVHTGFAIVTRNVSDFKNAPIETINPWSAPRL